jgi:predicted kinase/8-oxo-dGTP pyrophosphatase MutT (NUDIX family)/diadenosine tetraphosphatase ApaH/serine/threonine PP2A family protein phosphatase
VKLQLPELSLVVLVGPSGCGKSTFARRHFLPTEVISSDFCRGLVSNDENSQDATGDAFDVLRFVVGKRLARGLLTVIDATNVQPESRRSLVELAREHDVLPVAIVLRMPEEVCHERNKARPDRTFGPHVVRNQLMQLRRGIRGLEREGFRYVHILNSPEEVEQVEGIERQPLWNNRRWDKGPFDIIGDVHGCYDELIALLHKLGYQMYATLDDDDPLGPMKIVHPQGRKAVFVGDLVDRGPDVVPTLKLTMRMVRDGHALCVPGNHDVKLLRKLRGRNVQITHGLAETLQQLESQPPAFIRAVEQFLDSLVGHYVLDDGRLVVAHAGLKERYIGRASQRVREFALYGETTGETDEFGLPVRYNWAAEYRGGPHVVYGHTPVPEADWLNRTINIDTGCVFGGKLTALRWPEKEIVSVAARQVYSEPVRPLAPARELGEAPVFGERLAGHEYRSRPGAYAFIRDEKGRVAVIRVPTGVFLPGGGSDPGETPEQTLVREMLEETGHEVRIGRPIARATQLVGTPERGLIEKVGTYFEATLGPRVGEPAERDHALEWLPPDEAARALKHPAQQWVVRRATDPGLSAQQLHDDVLDLADVTGKRIVTTRLHHSVTVRAENATAALEVMSRFAASPKWLIYLPPTMSPTETTDQPGLLEHPRQAFDYFRSQGVGRVICEEKHMGSRAVVVVCKEADAAARRFGVRTEDEAVNGGIVYTRTGRRFFDDLGTERELLDVVRGALTAANFWGEFASDWFCLDCELMPWSAKAQELLKSQYAAVGSASRAALAESVTVLERAAERYGGQTGADDVTRLVSVQRDRLARAGRYVEAYRQYCWPVRSVADLKLAPFHLLASEGRVHVDKDHAWHMATLARLATAPPGSPLMATTHHVVDVTEPAQVDAGVAWWEQLTAGGGEGMVVKPLEFVVRGKRGLVQPAVKCRGPEYLRIIYGPEYDAPANLARLRSRGLAAKRSLALREFALGIESLERFVRREPLRRVHECVFGVLALESEPVDPRL